jgi:hypothetical protein
METLSVSAQMSYLTPTRGFGKKFSARGPVTPRCRRILYITRSTTRLPVSMFLVTQITLACGASFRTPSRTRPWENRSRSCKAIVISSWYAYTREPKPAAPWTSKHGTTGLYLICLEICAMVNPLAVFEIAKATHGSTSSANQFKLSITSV